MKFLRHIEPQHLRLLKNKYVLVALLMGTWLLIFDKNNLIDRISTSWELHKLEEDREYYLQQIEETKQMKEELFGSPEKLEKFAREKYLMKRPDEDLYIIVERAEDQ